MKTLGNLKPSKGSNHKTKRVGRGTGSGLGKTSGRGHKGSGQRKSKAIPPGFEGGQVPLYRRLPKRGFHNKFADPCNAINLETLNKLEKEKKITPEVLAAHGLLQFPEGKVKILAKGELKKAVTVAAHKFSKNAKAAIEKAGGKVEEI